MLALRAFASACLNRLTRLVSWDRGHTKINPAHLSAAFAIVEEAAAKQ
jgi:hypothetical protein